MKVQSEPRKDLNHDSPPPVSQYGEALAQFLTHHWPDSVYENNYLQGHRQAMRSSFPVCAHLFDHYEASLIFDELLAAYVLNTRTLHWDINQFGTTFPSFLAAQSHSTKAEIYPWQQLSDIANIETTLNQYYYGGLADNEHANLPWGQLLDSATSELYALVLLFKQFHPYMLITPQLVQQLCDGSYDQNLDTLSVRFTRDSDTRVPRLTLYACS